MKIEAPAERTLRVVIVDDEPLARQAIHEVLRHDAELEIVAQCDDGESAIEALRREVPDIVVLDIQMPEIDGFEVLRRLGMRETPAVIFVTAYDEFAVSAFEQEALDYVLKPFSEARLQKAVARAKEQVRGADLSDLGQRVLRLTQAASVRTTPHLERIAVPKGDRTIVLEVDQIDWIEAADYYARLHTGGQSHLIRKPLKWFEEKLDAERFVRVHRSAMVNVSRVQEIRRLQPGDHVVIMPGEQLVALSRAGRDALTRLIG